MHDLEYAAVALPKNQPLKWFQKITPNTGSILLA
jgi:hypothetical protein